MMLGENIDFLRGSTLMINPLTILMMHEKIKKRKHKVVIHSAISSDLAILFLRWCHYSHITCITIVSTQQEYEKLKSASPEYSLIQEHSTFAEELKGSANTSNLPVPSTASAAVCLQISLVPWKAKENCSYTAVPARNSSPGSMLQTSFFSKETGRTSV